MRVLKLVFASVAALIIFSGSAYAIEVNKKIAAPGDPEDIWDMISDFCSIQDWHPVVEQCDESEEGGDTFRTLTLKGGGKIKEKLVDYDDESYTYQIVESPLPVKNYQAKIWVEEDSRQPDRTDIHWDATFDANGASDEDAAKTISDIFTAGLKNIKHMALQSEDDQEDKD
jgi:Polyketide cyclase / dehydrase and lipid transport